MTCEEARKYLWREPFQPVRIRLKDGRRYDIFYKGWTLAAEAILMIGVPPADDPGSRHPGRMEWVRWPEVETIEPLSDRADRPCEGENAMNYEEARKYLWRKPFQPVRIRLKDGRTFDIRYRGWTIAAEALLMVGTPPADDPGSRFPDQLEWVRWPEVEAIEPLAEPVAPAV